MKSSQQLTLRAREVVPVAGRPLGAGWVTMSRGRIVALGAGRPDGDAIDLGDAIIMPGLVNAHTHLEFSDLKTPLPGAGGLPEWIDRVVAIRRSRSAGGGSTAGLVIRAGLEESVAAGVTTIGEIATQVPPRAAGAGGPRLRVFRESLGLTGPARAEALSALRRDLGQLTSAGIAAGVSPHAPYSVDASLGRRVLDVARLRGLPATMHLGESPAEEELIVGGSGPFRALLESLDAWPAEAPRLLSAADWISLLAHGPRGLVVHGTFLSDEALARLARHRRRLGVAICPRTTRLLAGVLPPLPRFRAAGLRVALGTDSRASSPDLSVLAECRELVGAGLSSPAEALRMATLDGAWSLGLEARAGILAPGRPADIVVLRPAHPAGDPHEAALAPTTQVAATFIGGQAIFTYTGEPLPDVAGPPPGRKR